MAIVAVAAVSGLLVALAAERPRAAEALLEAPLADAGLLLLADSSRGRAAT